MRHDLRLLVPAVVAWGAGAALVEGTSRIAIGVGVVLVLGTAAAARSYAPVALALGCAALVVTSVAWRLAVVEHAPLRSAIGQAVTLDAVVVRDARVFGRFGSEASVVEVSTAAGRATAFLDDAGRDLVVGRHVTLTGRVGPPGSTRDAATLDVTRRGEVTGGGVGWEAAERVREGVRSSVAHREEAGAALVPALVDGDDADIPEDVAEDFRRSGLTHLLAVSGTNLTIVLALVLTAGRGAGLHRRGWPVLGLLAIGGFVMVARPDPSVVRAAAMGAVGLLALGNGVRGGVRALGVAVVGLLVLDPWLAREAGFLLSACATWGIVVGAEPLASRLGRWMPRWLAVALAVPLAAQLACTPVIVALSGEVSLVAVPANLLAGPLVAPATVLGLVGGLADVVAGPLARVLGTLAVQCADAIVGIARLFADLEGGSLPWRAPWWATLIGTPLAAMLAWRLAAHRLVVIGLVVGVVLAVLRPPQPGWPPDGWIMVSCSVGQGDATVVAAGRGRAVLVDTGPEPRAVDHCLRRLGIHTLLAVVLTHAHADHYGGWRGAVRGREVGPLVFGGTGGVHGWEGETHEASAGEILRWGPVVAEVLWPRPDAPTPDPLDGSGVNDASLVLRVDVSGTRLMLTGDVEPPGQDALVQAGVDLRADVLKFPHHGSSRQSRAFFEAVSPRVATISAGIGNDYGHPAAAALDLLRDLGIPWRRTDTDGDIALCLQDGRLVVVSRR